MAATNKTAQAPNRNDLYAAYGRSRPQRIVMAVIVAVCVGAAWWILSGPGIQWANARFGLHWRLGNAFRRALLGVALTLYFARLLFTQFVFLKRAIRWSEAWTVGSWILVIYLVLACFGGTNPDPFAAGGVAGCVLFLLGSWMNSYAEYARHVWKGRLENRGRLFTGGLFGYSRHPNYLGDLISFSGLCLIAGRWPTFAIPLIMLAGFVFVNIPMLDSHLRRHYGQAFDSYAERTSKLIPFVY